MNDDDDDDDNKLAPCVHFIHSVCILNAVRSVTLHSASEWMGTAITVLKLVAILASDRPFNEI